jgi:hypothetical protein
MNEKESVLDILNDPARWLFPVFVVSPFIGSSRKELRIESQYAAEVPRAMKFSSLLSQMADSLDT